MEKVLMEFFREASSYQSIDPTCFDLKEFTETWIESYKQQLILNGVVPSVLCISDEKDCLNITKGKKYPLIESDNIFFRVVNDLGNEQLYYNYRFKRL